LPITFKEWDNFLTKNVVFDVAHFDLPYNAILSRPALAKFMAAMHYAYGTLKIPGPSGVISVKADVKGSMRCTKRLYKAMAAISPDDGECPKPSACPPAWQRFAPYDAALTKVIHLGTNPEKTVTIGAQLGKKIGKRACLLPPS
jgi:hypothetical protein